MTPTMGPKANEPSAMRLSVIMQNTRYPAAIAQVSATGWGRANDEVSP